MNKFLVLMVCCLGWSGLNAANGEQLEECTKELLLSYYPEPFVRNALKKFKISEDQWDAIVASLANKDKDVIRNVEEKAEKMNPNPLQDPRQRQVVVKLFHETLYELFASVMNEHGVTDQAQLQAMLDDIQSQKAMTFTKCIEQERNEEEVEVEDVEMDVDEDAVNDDDFPEDE